MSRQQHSEDDECTPSAHTRVRGAQDQGQNYGQPRQSYAYIPSDSCDPPNPQTVNHGGYAQAQANQGYGQYTQDDCPPDDQTTQEGKGGKKKKGSKGQIPLADCPSDDQATQGGHGASGGKNAQDEYKSGQIPLADCPDQATQGGYGASDDQATQGRKLGKKKSSASKGKTTQDGSPSYDQKTPSCNQFQSGNQNQLYGSAGKDANSCLAKDQAAADKDNKRNDSKTSNCDTGNNDNGKTKPGAIRYDDKGC